MLSLSLGYGYRYAMEGTGEVAYGGVGCLIFDILGAGGLPDLSLYYSFAGVAQLVERGTV